MPGVGEALKREIAGLGLVEQWWLWGFEGCGCSGCDWAGWLRGAFAGKRMMSFAGFWPICVVPQRCYRLLPLRYLDLRMTACPQAVWRAAETMIFDVWRALHAAALAVVGGALGCCAGAIVLMMINWPPQHGQGSARTRGGSSVSPRLSSLA